MKSYPAKFKSFRLKIAQMGALQKLPNSIQTLRDGSLFMGMTRSDKKWPGHEKFRPRNDGPRVF